MKSSDAKPAEAKPTDPKPAEPKPTEAKPADAKPAEAKPADPKPAAGAPAAKPADGDDDDDDDDDDSSDNDHPQPVRAGDLLGRDVIAPVESQNLIGHVKHLVRNGDGDVEVVLTTGGYLGGYLSWGSRLVCLPLDDLSLTGYHIQVTGFDTDKIDTLPTCTGSGSAAVDPNTMLQVGLAKPAH